MSSASASTAWFLTTACLMTSLPGQGCWHCPTTALNRTISNEGTRVDKPRGTPRGSSQPVNNGKKKRSPKMFNSNPCAQRTGGKRFFLPSPEREKRIKHPTQTKTPQSAEVRHVGKQQLQQRPLQARQVVGQLQVLLLHRPDVRQQRVEGPLQTDGHLPLAVLLADHIKIWLVPVRRRGVCARGVHEMCMRFARGVHEIYGRVTAGGGSAGGGS